jgi:hypothetical protein
MLAQGCWSQSLWSLVLPPLLLHLQDEREPYRSGFFSYPNAPILILLLLLPLLLLLLQDARERYVFFSFPHIAMDMEGQLGGIFRPNRPGRSCACGALQKVCCCAAAGGGGWRRGYKSSRFVVVLVDVVTTSCQQ